MATLVTRTSICDVCESDRGVTRWRITEPSGRTISADLCAEHQEPLTTIFKKLPTGKRGQVQKHKVVTEAQVRQARRNPRSTMPK
jgi:hypothetical protein